MDLLGARPELSLNDESWRIFSRHYAASPQYVGDEALIDDSIITEGCVVEGTVINSVLGSGVKVCRGAVVKDSVLMGDTVVSEGAAVNYSIIDTEVTVCAGAVIGEAKETASGIAVLGRGVKIAEGARIAAGEMVSAE